MNRLFLGFVLCGVVVLATRQEARALQPQAPWSVNSNCVVVATNAYATRMQCNFVIPGFPANPPLPPPPPLGRTITYASGSCTSTATGSFSVRQFQVVVIPPPPPMPLPPPVTFQLPIAPTPASFVNGSHTFAAAVVSISAAALQNATAFIDIMSPSASRNVMGCTVSFSGE